MGIKLHGVHSIPVPLHMDIGDCLNKCKYCFVGSTDKKTSLKQIENSINKKYDGSLLSYYLENRYPICISNTSDFFNCKDKELYKQEIKILKDAGFPLYYQTKGYIEDKDLEWFLDIIDKKDVVYITITSFSENELEKNVPVTNKIKLIKHLYEKNVYLNIGFNPIISKYIKNEEIIDFMKTYKNADYIIHPLHGIKNKYFYSKEINKLTRENVFKINDIIDFAIKNNISIRSKNLFAVGTLSYGDRLKKHFGKKIIIGSDIENVCKKYYNDYYNDRNETDESLAVGVLFREFYKEKKNEILDITLKSSEIRIIDNFISKRLPKYISYKDYLELCWQNPKHINSFCTFSSVIWDYEDDNNIEVEYYYPLQKILIKNLEIIRRWL